MLILCVNAKIKLKVEDLLKKKKLQVYFKHIVKLGMSFDVFVVGLCEYKVCSRSPRYRKIEFF